MSRFWKPSLVLLLVLLPGALAQGPHGLSDHHAFMAGLTEVPADDFVYFQINHTYFKWATVWYSARVREGPSIVAFMVDEANFARYKADDPFDPLENTIDGPAAETGGLASTLPSGLYFLVFGNEGGQLALVKWEIFLEPRFQGDPGTLSGSGPAPDLTPWLVVLVGGSAVALVVGLYLLRRRG